MLRNLSKYYLFICCKQSSSTHFCHFLATAFVTDVLAGSNPPCDGPEKRKASIAGGLTIRWWAMRDVACGFAARFRFGPTALACCAGKRLRVSSAPHPVGFESHEMGANKTVPLRGPFPIRWWAMRDVACGFAARFRFGPTALACCAGKRLRVSSAPHPVGFESHEMGANKTVPLRGPFPIQWWAMRDSNPQPCACKAPALTVAPIARAERV